MAVDYPPEFSAPARARVEAEELKRRKVLAERRKAVASSPYGANLPNEENLREYILQVFLIFAREACKLGSQRLWAVDRIRTEAEEFLRKFTIEAYYAEGHDKNGRKLREMVSNWGGSLLPEVEREFRASAEWQQYEEELLGVALEVAGEGQRDSEQTLVAESGLPVSKKRNRTMLVDKFLEKCNAAGEGPKVKKTHIWKAVGHTTARQFQYWQAGDDRHSGGTRGATEEDDRNFRRILAMSPADFRALFQKKGLI
jgi:hypothetical protein